MSADELRLAAETLRNRALCASEGPWESDQFHSSVWADHGDCLVVRSEVDGPDADLDYIATVHPGIGLALAEWLDEAAECREGAEALLGTIAFVTSCDVRPITLARLINGGTE